MSRSHSTTFAMVPFDDKHQNVCKVIIKHFRLLSPISDSSISKLFTLNCKSRSRCTTFAKTPPFAKYMNSYLMATLRLALSHHLRYIRNSNNMRTLWSWKWRLGQEGEDWDLCNSIDNAWFHVGDFFPRILAIRQHVYLNLDTSIHTHTQTYIHT